MRLWVGIVLTLTACAGAQTPPTGGGSAPDATPDTLTARTSLVIVPALVRTKGGDLVFTLKAKDFVLTDDGVEQKLNLEEDTGGEPLALVVAIEGGGEGQRQLQKYNTVGTMLDAIVASVPHKVAVVGFDSGPILLQDFTPDLGAVSTAIQTLEGGDQGAAILDALSFSVDLLRKQPAEYRRAILLISESVDRGSHVKLAEALRAIGDTNTVIYSVGFSSAVSESKHEAGKLLGDSNPGPAGGCMAKDHADDPETSNNRAVQAFDCLSLLAPPLRLARIAYIAATAGLKTNIPETVAKLTGGEYFKLTSERGLERSIQTIGNHLPNRYVLSFHPQSPHPGLHAIGLKLRDYTNLTVNARSSYWADDSVVGSAKR